MKKRYYSIFASLLLLTGGVSSTSAAVSFSGDVLKGTPGLEDEQKGVFLVDADAVGFDSLVGEIAPGLDLSLSSTYSGSWGTFEVLTVNTADAVLGQVALPGTLAGYTYGGDVNVGDSFGFVVYESSSSTINLGDNYDIWTAADWDMPSDGASLAFGTDFTQYDSSDTPSFTGTAIPEPSAYATILGFLGLGYAVFCRRRRSSSTD